MSCEIAIFILCCPGAPGGLPIIRQFACCFNKGYGRTVALVVCPQTKNGTGVRIGHDADAAVPGEFLVAQLQDLRPRFFLDLVRKDIGFFVAALDHLQGEHLQICGSGHGVRVRRR